MFYLVYPNGSRLFCEPVSEDFAYHCLLLAIDKNLGLTAVKAPTLVGALFFVRLLAPYRLPPPFLSAYFLNFCYAVPEKCIRLGTLFRLPKDVRLCDFLVCSFPAYVSGSVSVGFIMGRLVSPTLCNKKVLTNSPNCCILNSGTKGR